MFFDMDFECICITCIGAIFDLPYPDIFYTGLHYEDNEHTKYDDSDTGADFLELIFHHFFHRKTIHLPHEKQATQLSQIFFFYHEYMTNK